MNWTESIKAYEPPDEHCRNERAQIMTVILGMEAGFLLTEVEIQEYRERAEYLLAGKIHHKRKDR